MGYIAIGKESAKGMMAGVGSRGGGGGSEEKGWGKRLAFKVPKNTTYCGESKEWGVRGGSLRKNSSFLNLYTEPTEEHTVRKDHPALCTGGSREFASGGRRFGSKISSYKAIMKEGR